MIHWIWISLVSGITVLLVTLYFNLGAYKDVPLEIKSYPAFHVVYKKHVGPYHKIEPVIQAVEKWAKDSGVKCLKAFGEYLDKPGTIEDSRLRSHGGCVVTAPQANLPDGLLYKFIEENKSIYATFRGAPSIGPLIVYPKIETVIEEKRLKIKGSAFEFYNTPSSKESLTEYLFPIEP